MNYRDRIRIMNAVLAVAVVVFLAQSGTFCELAHARQIRENGWQKLADGSLAADVYIPTENGLFVYCCIRRPAAEGRYPAVVLIHGGLGGNVQGTRYFGLGIGKDALSRILVEKGYVLASIDYRAHDFGGKEVDDVCTAYEFLNEQSYVQPGNIAYLGGSHGAYLALRAAMELPLRAVVDHAGPTCEPSWLSKEIAPENIKALEGSPFQPRLTIIKELLARFGYYSEHPERYEHLRILPQADRIRCPVLIQHGRKDSAVDVTMSLELGERLEELGKPHEMLIVEKGPHGFLTGIAHPPEDKHLLDPEETRLAVRTIVEFLDKYMKR